MAKATELRPGMAVIREGKLFVITKFTHVTPGNLRAKVTLKLKGVKSGLTTEERLRADEDVEKVELDRRDIEYLYKEGNKYVFMDTITYEQFEIEEDIVGEVMPYLKINTVINGLLLDDKVVTVEPPKVVELKITEADPSVKTATATNVLKDAVCETGLKVRVPQHINVGDTIRVGTTEGDYLSRA